MKVATRRFILTTELLLTGDGTITIGQIKEIFQRLMFDERNANNPDVRVNVLTVESLGEVATVKGE